MAEAPSSGWQVWTHGNGDAAVDSSLDAYEKALAHAARTDHRHRIEHRQTAGEDQLDRTEELGIAVSFVAPHVWYWGQALDIFLDSKRAARMDPLTSALGRGIRFGLHNASPMSLISPLLSISAAVSRRTSGGKDLVSGQAMPVDQALGSVALDSAYLAFEEELKGTLI